jgi:hypothetical protein
MADRFPSIEDLDAGMPIQSHLKSISNIHKVNLAALMATPTSSITAQTIATFSRVNEHS